MVVPTSQGGGKNQEGPACPDHSQPLTTATGPRVYTPWMGDLTGSGLCRSSRKVSNLAAHWSHLHLILGDSHFILLGSDLGGSRDC